MKIKELLFEYNLQNLLSLFQQKYKETKEKDPSNKYENLEDFIKSIEDPLRKEGKFQFINPYMKWIVQRYVTGKLNKFEDVVSKVIPGLLKYDGLKRKKKLKPEHKDINSIKGINDFLDMLDHYKEEDIKSGKEKEKEIEENFYKTGEAILVHDSPSFKVIIPKSERASCFFGRNTRWCTASTKGENYFSEYAKKGDLFIIIIKKENKRFQLHFKTKQFKDEKDEDIDLNIFYKKYPEVFSFIENIAKKYNSAYFKNPKNITRKELLSHKRDKNLIFFALQHNPEIFDENTIEILIKETPTLFFKFVKSGIIPIKLQKKLLLDANVILTLVDAKADIEHLLDDETIVNMVLNPEYVLSGVLRYDQIRKKLSSKIMKEILKKSKKSYHNMIITLIQIYSFNLNKIKEDKNGIDNVITILETISNDNSIDERINTIILEYIFNIITYLMENNLIDSKLENTIDNFFKNKEYLIMDFYQSYLSSEKFLNKFGKYVKKHYGNKKNNVFFIVYGNISSPDDVYKLYKNEKFDVFLFLKTAMDMGNVDERKLSDILIYLFQKDSYLLYMILREGSLSGGKYSRYYTFFEKIISKDFLERLEDSVKNNKIKIDKNENWLEKLLSILHKNYPQLFFSFGENVPLIKKMKESLIKKHNR